MLVVIVSDFSCSRCLDGVSSVSESGYEMPLLVVWWYWSWFQESKEISDPSRACNCGLTVVGMVVYLTLACFSLYL